MVYSASNSGLPSGKSPPLDEPADPTGIKKIQPPSLKLLLRRVNFSKSVAFVAQSVKKLKK
jgi:hypothetical protein